MNSNNNRSPPLRTGEICTVSPIGLSPDEMIATLEQDRSVAPGLNTNAARRGFVHRNTRRTVWWPLRLAAFLVVVAPLLVTLSRRPRSRTKDRSWSAPSRSALPIRGRQSHCPPTATPPSWAGLWTTSSTVRCGSSPATGLSGPSRAAS